MRGTWWAWWAEPIFAIGVPLLLSISIVWAARRSWIALVGMTVVLVSISLVPIFLGVEYVRFSIRSSESVYSLWQVTVATALVAFIVAVWRAFRSPHVGAVVVGIIVAFLVLGFQPYIT